MMQDKTQSELTIRKIDDGGYIVTTIGQGGFATIFHIATSTLDEAIEFIRRKMK